MQDLYKRFKFDHRPVVAHARCPFGDFPQQPRPVSLKGWRPQTDDDKEEFQRQILECKQDLTDLEKNIREIAASTAHNCSLRPVEDKERVFNEKLAEARQQMLTAKDTVAIVQIKRQIRKLRRGRGRLRRRARLRGLAKNATTELYVPTCFEIGARVSADRREWLTALRTFGTQRFGSESNTNGAQLERVARFVKLAENERLDGTNQVKLDFHDFLQARAALKCGTGTGVDGLPPEVYKALPWKSLLHVYHLFKQRLRFEPAGESPYWKVLQFLGIPKVAGARAFHDLRWICKSAVLQKWYVRTMRPQLRSCLRPSWVHTYGFKQSCRTSNITALVRQLQYLAIGWGLPLLVALQDVELAFDSMQHELIATALQARGAAPSIVAAHLRELTGLNAVMTIPNAGDTNSFPYSKGGKQGGVETPDEWNAVIDFLEPLVVSWTLREFGFRMDYSDVDFKLVHHAVWCDNIILFARDQIMLQTMLNEISDRFQRFELFWKPSSLEVIPGGSFANNFEYEFRVAQRGKHLAYAVVDQALLLGEMLNRVGSTGTSIQYRQCIADSTYFKHRAVLQSPGNIIARIRAWEASPATSAIFGCESWHATAALLQSVQTWEYQKLRSMFRFRRKDTDTQEQYNKRTARVMRKWFEYAGASFCTHRILRTLYKEAWFETMTGLNFEQQPLRWARE